MELNVQQEVVASHTVGPLLVLAVPGAGKTRCLTERMTRLIRSGVSPRSILAVTFTNKAANEMKERVARNVPSKDLWISTFHSMCARMLRQCYRFIGLKRNFTIYDESDALLLMRQCMKQHEIDTKQIKPEWMLARLESKKSNLIDDAVFFDGSDAREIKAYRDYEALKRRSNSLDFADLLYEVIVLFDKHPNIQRAFAERFEYIMVDEMQDTNIIQLEIIKRLASIHKNVVVVADYDQCIYTWRFASPRNITEFQTHFGDSTVRLETNYRSTPQILEPAARLIKRNVERQDVTLRTDNGEGSQVEFVLADNSRAEAGGIADDIIWKIRELGLDYRDFAILYRVNALSRNFEEIFRMRNIPYILVGSYGFYDRKEVKTALSFMKLLDNDDDSVSFENVVNTPPRGIGPAKISKLRAFAEVNKVSFMDACRRLDEIKGLGRAAAQTLREFVILFDRDKDLGPNPRYCRLLRDSGYLQMLSEADERKGEHRLDNVEELMNSFRIFCSRGSDPTYTQYLQEISLMTSSDDDPDDENRVKLMTIHASKGLEFPSVYVVGLEEGILPHQRAIDAGDVEEERRLCYVAMTRAKDNLQLTGSSVRMVHGSDELRPISRFVKEAGLVEDDD